MSVSPLCTGRLVVFGEGCLLPSTEQVLLGGLHTDKGIARSCLAMFSPWPASPAHLLVGMGSTAQLWLSHQSRREKTESKWKQHHNSILHMGFGSKDKLGAEKQPGCFWRQSAQCDCHLCGSQRCRLDRLFPRSWPLGVELWTDRVTSLVTLFLGTH